MESSEGFEPPILGLQPSVLSLLTNRTLAPEVGLEPTRILIENQTARLFAFSGKTGSPWRNRTSVHRLEGEYPIHWMNRP